jgi:hypothetical protein
VHCRGEVEVNPPWLSSLEEEDPLKHEAPRCEEAPLARRSSGATSPLLMLFARRSFEGHPWNSRSGRLPSPPTTTAAPDLGKTGRRRAPASLLGGGAEEDAPSIFGSNQRSSMGREVSTTGREQLESSGHHSLRIHGMTPDRHNAKLPTELEPRLLCTGGRSPLSLRLRLARPPEGRGRGAGGSLVTLKKRS